MKPISKRLTLYIFGLFLLSLGVSFSIQANLGVSPVSSLAYAFSLTAGLSIGITTIIANCLFIVLQVILDKRIKWREFAVQLLLSLVFGIFMDSTLALVQILPTPETLLARFVFLLISLLIIATGILFYFTTKLPLMPYDALTYVISNRFDMKFHKAKIMSDLLNVTIAGAVSVIFIKSLGSIGIGTIAAAYFVGKILSWLMPRFQHPLQVWIDSGKKRATINKTRLLDPAKSRY
ncbi:YitT family protein [Sporosarcina sp. PTS2304]|uniref:YczE/YyaS/YitT family protein n=1 Tax=Sporosarcina sp. PTS2304 TaxID=2283194 RepID=UPI001F08023D|nr:DUF6198 family protein [Sporosarcina sp. PTS2304]